MSIVRVETEIELEPVISNESLVPVEKNVFDQIKDLVGETANKEELRAWRELLEPRRQHYQRGSKSSQTIRERLRRVWLKK